MNPLNKLIVSFVQLLPKSVVRLFSNKYIAGDKLEDAIRVTKELNLKGILATIDVLGESITSTAEAEIAKKECVQVLDAIRKQELKANLSIKPTQMGLMLNEDFCYSQVEELVSKAESMNNFVRIDMEDSPTTDKTFNLYKKLREKYESVGVVIQAYLKRSYDDVSKLNKMGTTYRLCKGIYIEPEEIAFKNRQKIRDNYLKILRKMFEDGNYVGIATHDEYIVNEAYKMIKGLNIPKTQFEFQMLLGVREDLRDKINKDGYKIRIYVPFGEHWYKYSIRRLKENPNIAWHITKNIFSFR
jgi:proline dehydrogenase